MKGTGFDTAPAVQGLLLCATFRSDDRGTHAWRAWKSSADLDDHLDLGSFRLLPELSRRLRQRGIADPLLGRFAGVSRKHWLANRLFFRELGALARALRARDVRVMVPAEMALALQHYPDYPLDPIVSRALVVPAESAVNAVHVLEAAGWTPTPRIGGSVLKHYVAARSWHPFRGPGGSRLRLHWHVLPQRPTRTVDREYWSRGREVSIGDETVVALSVTDQIVQLCARRSGMRPAPLFERAVDVMMLVSACRSEIDWERLIEESAKPGLILPIQETLRYLQDQLDEPLLASAVDRICCHPVSVLERLEFALSRGSAPGISATISLWLDYRRSTSTPLLASAAGFPRYLQHYLRLAHIWQVPLRVVARVMDPWRESIRGRPTSPREVRDAAISRK